MSNLQKLILHRRTILGTREIFVRLKIKGTDRAFKAYGQAQ